MLWCDFLAIVPFYLDAISPRLDFPVLKALRMLRLLKLSRQYDGSIVIVRALKARPRARFSLSSALCPRRAAPRVTAAALSSLSERLVGALRPAVLPHVRRHHLRPGCSLQSVM